MTNQICLRCRKPSDEILCQRCEDEAQENNRRLRAQELESKRIRLEKSWLNICEGYQGAVPGKMADPIKAIYEYWNAEKPSSITIMGPSGVGKTSAAFVFAGTCHFAGLKVKYWHASELRKMTIKAAKNSEEWGDRFKDEFCRPDLLIIDDLGQTAKTDASNEYLLALLEALRARGIPAIITTQYRGNELAMSFGNEKAGSEKIGIAITRRIGKDYAKVINLYGQPAATLF